MNDFTRMTRIAAIVKRGQRDCQQITNLVRKYGLHVTQLDMRKTQDWISTCVMDDVKQVIGLPNDYPAKDPRDI